MEIKLLNEPSNSLNFSMSITKEEAMDFIWVSRNIGGKSHFRMHIAKLAMSFIDAFKITAKELDAFAQRRNIYLENGSLYMKDNIDNYKDIWSINRPSWNG